MENHRSNRRRPFSASNSSDDSLYVPVNNGLTIKRWNGITREAINWNSLPRDPELFFPTGNCLVYLYPAGHSQRGPSFRIPYHILLYSGCRPLVQQCLVSQLNISSPDHVISKSLSHGSVDYSLSQDTRSYLYLYPPAGLSRDESYSYHITTRNFFAWLLGVPLVGTDPVSALLDLKARMDTWRDPHANNFEAIFEYARQQAYGDFEEIQIEMDKRIESGRTPERTPERMTMRPFDQAQPRDRQYRQNSSMVRRSDSLKRRLRSGISKASKSHIASQDKRAEQVPPHIEKRQPLPRLTTFQTMPGVPSTTLVDGTIKRLSGPARPQSSNAISPIQARDMGKVYRHTSSSTSNSPVSPITPVDRNGIDAALQRLTGPPSSESVVTVSNSQAKKANKKKHRVSWADNNPTVAEARSSQTDLTYPNMQGLGLQSAQASSSAINVGQLSPSARRSLTSLPLSSHPVAGSSKRASMPIYSTIAPWGEEIRLARPMSTASLISIPSMRQTSTPATVEPCSCGKMRRPDTGTFPNHLQQSRPQSAVEPCTYCGKMRKTDTGTSQDHHQQSRPASARSMKSFRSTKSWRSLRSIGSSFSLHSIRSSMSLSSVRSYISRRTPKTSFADIQTSMKNRRNAFKGRLNKKDKKSDVRVDVDNDNDNDNDRSTRLQNNVPQSCNPIDYATLRPKPRFQRASLTALSPAPVELEAEPVAMKTVPELTSSDTPSRSPGSYSDTPYTPGTSLDDTPAVTTTIRPKEIYTSREYRHQPKPRRPTDVSDLLRLPDEEADVTLLDIGTPGGFEEDFVDTLIAQLEAAGISERVTSKSKGKGKARMGEVDIVDEGGVWMGMTSRVGVPRLEVRAMG